MVSLPPSNKKSYSKNIIKSVALTAMAAQSAAGLRVNTSRQIEPQFAAGNATLADFVEAAGPSRNATRSAGRIAGAVEGGFRAVADPDVARLTRPQHHAPAPSPANGGRKLLTAGLLSAKMYGCPVAGYTVTSTVGSQAVWSLLDTGSSTFAVASGQCTDCDTPTPGYTPGKTATVSQQSVKAGYGIGDWSGTLVTDQVALAGGPAVQVTFGDITQQSDFFDADACAYNDLGPVNHQAIMGLADTDLLVSGTTSYFNAVRSELAYPGYAFGMCNTNGEFFLGGYPTNYLAGELVRTPTVSTSSYLAIGMLGLKVGNTDTGVTYNSLGATIVDTGTSIMMLPPAAYEAVTAAIVAQSGGLLTQGFFDQNLCLSNADTAALPAMQFKLYNPAYPDGSQYFTLTQPAGSSYVMTRYDADNTAWVCAMLQSSGTENPQSLLGATAMRDLLVFFDREAEQVGFGSSTGICS